MQNEMSFEKVKTYFNSRHIHASDDWIKSCLSWYKENYNAEALADNVIQVIYEQWLIADLRDMEIGCLPTNLKSHKKITLPGKYALQMHYVIDSSKPAYSQLQQLRNINTSNELVTAETQLTFVSAPKPNRVLNLLLCDGVQEIKGMEYRPITKISTELTPGIKLLVIGPVDCRNGVLFLKENNIQILGGEIEDILQKNAYENVLCRAIGLPENPNPFVKQTGEIVDKNDHQIPNFDEDDDLMASIPITTYEQPSIPETKPIVLDQNVKFDDEFENIDFDFDDHTEIVPKTESQKYSNIGNTFNNDTSDLFEESTDIVPKMVSSQPFVYLKQLVDHRQNLPKTKYTVKARVKNLLDKLKFIHNQWHLKCEIVDATSSIVVDLSNRVIEELVGYTAEQMTIIRREIATSHFHKDQVVQALENAKLKLLSIDCLMDIEFMESKPNPVITKFKEFYYADLSALEKRISSVTS